MTGWAGGQCSINQALTNGTSTERRMWPERMLKGRGAQYKAIADAVCSLKSSVLFKMGSKSSGSANSTSHSSSSFLLPLPPDACAEIGLTTGSK